MKYKVGQKVHTYLGWGIITIADYCGTGGNWYIVEFSSGLRESFCENQLSLD